MSEYSQALAAHAKAGQYVVVSLDDVVPAPLKRSAKSEQSIKVPIDRHTPASLLHSETLSSYHQRRDCSDINENSVVEPVTVRFVHQVHSLTNRDYCAMLDDVFEIAERMPTFAGYSALPTAFNTHTQWVVICRFLDRQCFRIWRQEAQVDDKIVKLRQRKVFVSDKQEDFTATVFRGWNIKFTEDLAPNGDLNKPRLRRAVPKYRTLIVLLISLWATATLLSLTNQSPRDLKPALEAYFDLEGHPERLPLVLLLFYLVVAPITWLVVYPLLSSFLFSWLALPFPREPQNFWLWCLYRIFVW